MLKDKNRFFVVYYDDEKNAIRTKEELEEALSCASMGVVPDFWIDEKKLIVKCPPHKTQNQLDKAACKRFKPLDDTWVEFKLLKVRWDSESPNYGDANELMILCEDHSSGVDEAFAQMQDKSMRKLRKANSKYGDDFSTDGKTKLPKDIKKEILAKKDMNHNYPTAPTSNILRKQNSTLSKSHENSLGKENLLAGSNKEKSVKVPYKDSITKKSDKEKDIESSLNGLFTSSSTNSRGHLDLLRILGDVNDQSPSHLENGNAFDQEATIPPNEKDKNHKFPPPPTSNILRKQNSTLSKEGGYEHSLKGENLPTASNKQKAIIKSVKKINVPNNHSITKKSDKERVMESSLDDVNPSSSVNSRGHLDLLRVLEDANDQSPPHTENGSALFEAAAIPLNRPSRRLPLDSNNNITDVSGLVGILYALDDKLNRILAGQEQIIVQQCKAKINGEAYRGKDSTDLEWTEQKLALAHYLKGLVSDDLFTDFDKQIETSQNLRGKVFKYLMEKIDYNSWKNTVKCVLDAVMHREVQKLYSLKLLKGQSGKKALKDTHVYKLLFATVKAGTKKNSKSQPSNDKEIETHFGSVLKMAPFKGKDYKPKSKQKKSEKSVNLIANLLDVPLNENNFPAFSDGFDGEVVQNERQSKAYKRSADGSQEDDTFQSSDDDKRENASEKNVPKQKRKKVQRLTYEDTDDCDTITTKNDLSDRELSHESNYEEDSD